MVSSIPKENKHFTWCTNNECPMRMACGRLLRNDNILPDGALTQDFNPENAGDCEWFIVRDILAGEKDIFRGAGHRKHNLHAPGGKTRKRATPEELGIARPDLKVKRHIRMGFDINKSADPRPNEEEDNDQ